ncbi:Fungalysin/Thermolysin Extracellular metalloproteinase 5 [Ceratobasidium sp. 414]|nr:Fungalysin/Thermolysin Extracellular metalloproteinase 5 [Ceratobasidium sp. 414]
MVEKHGYSPNLFPPQPLANGTIPVGEFYRPRVNGRPLVPKHGNTLMLQLVITGMKHQPCRPSLFEARDAIIDADRALTGGENFCNLWAAFSSRGLGQDAWTVGGAPWGGAEHANGFKVPGRCK